ncbi:MAG: hypothetical protein WAO23_02855 [Dethiobacteria bacterium]
MPEWLFVHCGTRVVKILRSLTLPLDDRGGVIQSEAKNLGFLGKHLHCSINNSRICGQK